MADSLAHPGSGPQLIELGLEVPGLWKGEPVAKGQARENLCDGPETQVVFSLESGNRVHVVNCQIARRRNVATGKVDFAAKVVTAAEWDGFDGHGYLPKRIAPNPRPIAAAAGR